jgi:flavin-dependent dehydrogenase
VGKTWDGLLDHLCRTNEHLHERLAHARALLDRPLSIANVPYGFVHAGAPGDPEGLFRLGDQMGVIPSFSGDGISIALHSAQVAALTYLQHGNAASAYHRRVAREIGGQIGFASSLYDLSRAPLGRLALIMACRLYPGILGALAAWTRVPAPALRKTGVTLHPARAA